jgi:hypothetical protein
VRLPRRGRHVRRTSPWRASSSTLPEVAKVTVLRSNTARPAAWAICQPVGVVKRRRACCRYQVQRVARP